ncbi:hypothetical protein UPYG_G00153930 [Umbra pygmaea]|uniref:Uncharacterized protein n=1 Tax=Umbra pygmaea TaxID=75934 RepID=A0ABD0XFU3_UMBPY
MRTSNSMIFDPGMERGVPWGRDLFTFVTSAAGHMMRTLQKPRKNRPSKRQVNHRRFLHNMIQRKFAEIEAANHQLASVLLSSDMVNSKPSTPSQHPTTNDQSNNTCKAPVNADAETSLCPPQNESLAVKCSALGEHFSLNPPRHMDESCNNPSEGSCRLGGETDSPTNCRSTTSSARTLELKPGWDHFPTEAISCDMASEDSLYSWIDSIREQYETELRRDSNGTSPTQNHMALPINLHAPTTNQAPVSLELSCLSLDSCDFGVADISACSQAQRSMARCSAGESQRIDVLRLWGPEVEPRHDGSFGDGTDPSLETIWVPPCEEKSIAMDVHDKDLMFLNHSESFIEKLMLYTSGEGRSETIDDRGKDGYGYGCSMDPVSAIRDFCMFDSPVGRKVTDRQISCLNVPANPVSTDLHCILPESSTLYGTCSQSDSTFSLVKHDLNQTYIPFAGVARSFPAPVQAPHLLQVQTPPLEDDWLFTDIMEDGGLCL